MSDNLENEDKIKLWLEGKYNVTEWNIGIEEIKLLKPQIEFVNERKAREVLYCGAMGCGKSLALLIKIALHSYFFPNNLILLGRKTIMGIEKTILHDLFKILKPGTYRHKVKQNIIQFENGSEIILFGLDVLQRGADQEIRKSLQEIKGLNLGLVAIDSLAEIEKPIYDALGGRLRRMNVPIRQIVSNSNPELYWAYEWFKTNPRPNTRLITGSLLDNKEHSPQDYIDDMMSRPDSWKDKYVYGKWSPDVLLHSLVFAPEHIGKLEKMTRSPSGEENEFKIWKPPDQAIKYFIGVDSSAGVEDPAAISVASEQGELVATFNKLITIQGLIEKIHWIYSKYHGIYKPLLVVEINQMGYAVLEGTRDLNHYKRKKYDVDRYSQETERLGFVTDRRTKGELISHWQGLLNQPDFVKVYDKELTEQMKAFVWSDIASQAGAGCRFPFHDDLIFSTMLSYLPLEGKPELTVEQIRKIRQRRQDAAESKAIRQRQYGQYL